jgi:competence protein ComEA
MKQLLNQIKQYFGFSSSEASGFVVLIILILVFISLPIIYRLIPNTNSDFTQTDQQKLDSLQKELLARINHKKETNDYNKGDYDNNFDHFSSGKSNFTPKKLFSFDPNTISSDGFQSLGLPEFIAERIVKYRNAGGKFKSKEDLKKIYGLLPATYSKLEPYIQISGVGKIENKADFVQNASTNSSPSEVTSKYPPINSFAKKPVSFDLNRADTTVLMNIKGIGSKLSARIIKVREFYGGFYSVDQIKEVYGLEPEVIEEISKYAFVKNPVLRKININDASEIRHLALKPYISKAIINYRAQHGKFNSIDDLLNIKILDKESLEKIRPYLEL